MKLEELTRYPANPWFLVFFNLGFGALWYLFGVDSSNLFISIITAEIVLLGYGASVRREIATQAKLDELIHATQGAREDLEHIEDMAEDEIERKRV